MVLGSTAPQDEFTVEAKSFLPTDLLASHFFLPHNFRAAQMPQYLLHSWDTACLSFSAPSLDRGS